MKVAVCYVFPDLLHNTYIPHAQRFAATYMEHPPGAHDHDIHVLVTLGDPANKKAYARIFDPLPCEFHMHDNMGKDIGAFQMAAETIPCDLLVCLGAPVYFYRAGWLDRIVDSVERCGPGMFGCRAYADPRHHIRTTSFWMPPMLLASYPYVVHNDTRYEFEHGTKSITMHAKDSGFECYMVTWDACYPYSEWGRTPPGKNLMLDQWSERHGETE